MHVLQLLYNIKPCLTYFLGLCIILLLCCIINTNPYCTFCTLYYKPHAHVSFVLEYKEAEYKLKKQWYNVVEQHYYTVIATRSSLTARWQLCNQS